MLAQGFTAAPPAASVVSCTPCRVVLCPVGLPGGRSTCAGCSLPYGSGCQACGYTLAGSPLGLSAAFFPALRSAATVLCVAPTTSWGLAGFCGLPVGYSGCHWEVTPESGCQGCAWLPHVPCGGKKGYAHILANFVNYMSTGFSVGWSLPPLHLTWPDTL